MKLVTVSAVICTLFATLAFAQEATQATPQKLVDPPALHRVSKLPDLVEPLGDLFVQAHWEKAKSEAQPQKGGTPPPIREECCWEGGWGGHCICTPYPNPWCGGSGYHCAQ